MVPEESFRDFFVASAGAGAALVGLLFVAISIAPERNVQAGAPVERQATAESAFQALVNAFFISLIALLPGHSLGLATIVLSLFALLNSLRLSRILLRQWSGWHNGLRRAFLVFTSLVIYGWELYFGVLLTQHSNDVGAVYGLASLLMGVYGLGLIRAWELLGARRFSFIGWLSVLRESGASTAAAPPAGKRESQADSAAPHVELSEHGAQDR